MKSVNWITNLIRDNLIREGLDKKIWKNPDVDLNLSRAWNALGLYELTEDELCYLQYCLAPGNQNYSLLRQYLKSYAENYLSSQLYTSIFDYQMKEANPYSEIDYVIDLGCGHTGYWSCLQHLFPNATIYGVDKEIVTPKFISESIKYNKDTSFYISEITIFLDKMWKNYGPNIVMFMSDLLHCKVQNIETIYQHPNVKKCWTIVNENRPNALINWRLSKFGGALIDPDVFIAKDVRIDFYSDSHYNVVRPPQE